MPSAETTPPRQCSQQMKAPAGASTDPGPSNPPSMPRQDPVVARIQEQLLEVLAAVAQLTKQQEALTALRKLAPPPVTPPPATVPPATAPPATPQAAITPPPTEAPAAPTLALEPSFLPGTVLFQTPANSVPTAAPDVDAPARILGGNPQRQADGRWQLGSDFMNKLMRNKGYVKTKLSKKSNYDAYHGWFATTSEWVPAFTPFQLDELVTLSIRSVVRAATDPAPLRELERRNAFVLELLTWAKVTTKIKEVLCITPYNLRIALQKQVQGTRGAREFAMDFQDIAAQTGMDAGEAKLVLLSALNPKMKALLQQRLEAQETAEAAFLSIQECLEKVDYQTVLGLLKAPQLLEALEAVQLGQHTGKTPEAPRVSGVFGCGQGLGRACGGR